jgi:peptidoglycan/LPS O-acetylase OafA/YrhL
VAEPTPPEPPRPLGYLPALDGLRALAVAAVVMFHWPFPARFTGGWVGVQVFFVLSGFLITSILLADPPMPPRERLRRFYLKRVLRIFPLYFGYLLVAHIASAALIDVTAAESPLAHSYGQLLGELDANWGYLVTYTYNFMNWGNWLFERRVEQGVVFMHLWSLSVEEQFYLVFPLVLLAAGTRRRLATVAAAVVVTVPVLRWLGVLWATSAGASPFLAGGFVYQQTQFQADSLALGALLACLDLHALRHAGRWVTLTLVAVAAVLAANALDLGLRWHSLGLSMPELMLANGRHIYGYTLVNLFAAALIVWIVRREGRVPLLSWRPVVGLGRISYSVYVWHLAVIIVPFQLCRIESMEARGWSELPMLAATLAAIGALSWASYHTLERPFQRLRKTVLAD